MLFRLHPFREYLSVFVAAERSELAVSFVHSQLGRHHPPEIGRLLANAPLLLLVTVPELVDLYLDFADVLLRLFDRGSPVAFALPPEDVFGHFAHAPVLLADLVADLALAWLI